jgi:hypothetical protein
MKQSETLKNKLLVAAAIAATAILGVPVWAVGGRLEPAQVRRDLPIVSTDCRSQDFALFEGPDIHNIAVVDNGCQETVAELQTAIDSGLVTSPALFYLSELTSILGPGYSKLPCFLKAIEGTEYVGATLVIDRDVTLYEPLILPSRFTLAGTGIDGTGKLRFAGLDDGVAAVRFDNQATNITIRDISIGRVSGGVNVGIDVSRANKVFIRDVLVANFFAGIYGSRPNTAAISVYIDRCSVFGNDYNIVMHQNAFHWRVRDCIFNQARCVGLRIFGVQDDPVPPAAGTQAWGNDYLISGCRFEHCGSIGALIGSDSAMLMNNRFEQNGGVGGVGIRILPTATRTKLFSNILSANSIVDSSPAGQTQSLFNMVGP